MEFDRPYSRQEFIRFLKGFLSIAAQLNEQQIIPFRTKTNFATVATRLGSCELLDLNVYEVKHNSRNDGRFGLSKDAFRLIADEGISRALVVFVPEDSNDNYRFSLVELTLSWDDNNKVGRSYSNPRRYSYYLGKGVAYYTPNKYLNEPGRILSVEDLRNRFSVEILTKAFYNELSDWYAWAIKEIQFPNDITTTKDDTEYNHIAAIRLITRLIFVWFIKQRGLIPWQFFDEDYIRENLLENFNPNVKVDLFYKATDSKYYRAILQNLFFAMLNAPLCKEGSKEITERKFKNNRGQFDDNKLMRYRHLFKNPDLFLQLANSTVPFLNGGLFDCLDDKKSGMYYDGFSERKESIAQLRVPDYLFFGEEVGRGIDLSEYYGDKNKKKVSARGIIDILKRYNFTVEENMPFDKDISLDPELLGKVFENLLAAYNPETKQTARKQTGSFYTPREIVQYMVDESLIAHLKRTVSEELEAEYRKLLSYTDDTINLTEEQKEQIMLSLYNCKILDPACGSGAFPVGILQQMVHILTQIDPDNSRWQKMLFELAQDESSEVFKNSTEEERKEQLDDLYHSFNANFNRPDYSRKLYLIENCIYGVDIQPIAIQISKLRFFILLIIDQKPNNDPVDNFGIRPLPNLEAKFVAANSLIGLKREEGNLFNTKEIKEKENQLKIAKHKIFGAKTARTKRKYEDQVTQLREDIASMLLEQRLVGNEQAQQLAQWDMSDQNASAPFFDPEWMFGVKDGFDIVIANPPYGVINKKQNKGECISVPEDVLKEYKTNNEFIAAQGGMLNIFRLFIVKSINYLTRNGVFSEIFPLAFAGDVSAAKTRKFVFENTTPISFEAFPERDNPQKRVFENAKMSVCILTLIRSSNKSKKEFSIRINYNRWVEKDAATSSVSVNDILSMDQKYYTLPICGANHLKVLKKIYQNSLHFSDFGKCATGEIDMTFCKEAFSKMPTDFRLLRGANIGRYYITDNISQGENLFIKQEVLGKIKKIPQNIYVNPRIVMQGITGVNEHIRLKMAISTNAYCANSINYCVFKDNNESIDFFVGLFNSRLMNFVFKQFSTNSNVNGYEVDNLPIMRNCMIEKSIATIVRTMDSANLTDALETIDSFVYHLYDLTYDEVLIVAPENPITREQYESFNINTYAES